MDRDRAFLVYLASMVSIINLGLMVSRVTDPGPYLGLYTLIYIPGAYFARPRRPRAVWAIGFALFFAFVAYSSLVLAGWLK
ncbi:MAG: hypothetical protein ACP5HK_06910 [Acidilobus sp.]